MANSNVEIVADQYARSVKIELILDGSGSAWFDDISLINRGVIPGSVEITSFATIPNVSAGTAGSATYASAAAVIAALPTSVTANTSGGAISVPVNGWADTDTYNPNAAGSYTFTATLGAIPAGYANTGNYTATIEVVVVATGNTYIPPTATPTSSTTATTPKDDKVEIIFGDKAEKVATVEVEVKDNIKTTTITLDDAAAIEYLDKIAKANFEENKVNKVIIHVKNKSDVVIAELTGQTVKYMGDKDATLEIKTENVTYNIPAVNINIDDVLTQLETKVELRDIKVIISLQIPQRKL